MGYDVVVVGAGLFGATVARVAFDRGLKVVVVERRPHVAGLAYDYPLHGVNVHAYGPHVFHTHREEVWRFVLRFSPMWPFRLHPRATLGKEVYSIPINLQTLAQFAGVTTPQEMRHWVADRTRGREPGPDAESWLLSQIGPELYSAFYKGYTEKMWGVPCSQIPAFVVGRLPIRFEYNDRWFSDPFEGIPYYGYTRLVERMLEGIEHHLCFQWPKDATPSLLGAKTIVYTGSIDEAHGFRLGRLPYRTLKIRTISSATGPLQGCAMMNYPDPEVPYTRRIEHAHFTPGVSYDTNVLTEETPDAWDPGTDHLPMYPLPTAEAKALANEYQKLGGLLTFGGRLGTYRYLNMDQVIAEAMALGHTLCA